MAAPWDLPTIIDQLDFDEPDFEFEWIESSKVVLYAFPAVAIEMEGHPEPDEWPGFSPIDAATQVRLRLAMQTWDDLVSWTFEETAGNTHHIEFGFTTTDIGYAHGYFPFAFLDGEALIGRYLGGSVWFNPDTDDYNDLVDAAPGTYGFNTYIHEIGHALGLDHMGDYEAAFIPGSFQDTVVWSVMSYFGPDTFGTEQGENWDVQIGTTIWPWMPQTPQVNDIAAIQSMYGASTTTRTGDTTYGFNSNVTGTMAAILDFSLNAYPILSIFDSAGIDTIDLSGWSTPSEISLVPGTLSSVNGMTHNLGIAYSATIENVVGGAGADDITGNTASNRLTGGGGDDMIEGGGGDDTLLGGAGNDDLQGDAGTDTAVFDGNFASYTVTYVAATGGIRLASAATGTDTAAGVETFQFADTARTAAQLLPWNIVAGTANADSLAGSSGLDVVSGLGGNDTLSGSGGDDTIDGGAGIDIAVYAGLHAAYDVTVGTEVGVEGIEGDDVLTTVERLQFADGKLALDLGGNAGIVAKTLGAVFGADYVAEDAYVGIGLWLVDGGMSHAALVELALNVRVGAGAGYAQIVDVLYTNVIGVAPDAATRAMFVSMLEAGAFTPATLGVLAANTPYNAENIGLAGLAVTGLDYT